MAMTAAELALALGGALHGDGALELSGAAALEQAHGAELSFVESPKWLERARGSAAGCLLVPPGSALPGRTFIAVAEPRLAFARALALLYPEPAHEPGIDPSAVVDPTADVDPSAHIGAHASIAARAVIGAGAFVGPGSVIGEAACVGDGCRLVARVVLYPSTELGARVLVHAGAVLGSDGFGFVRGPDGLVKFRQVGRLVIEDDVEIGANTTIDRGALGLTVIRRGTKIDNLVQIAHNVEIGEDVAISAQVGIAGSSSLADRVTLAGQVGIGDHVRIEQDVMVGGQAGVLSGKIVRKGEVVWGTPARPLAEFKRQHAALARIAELRAEVRELARRLGAAGEAGRDDDDPGSAGS